jgi:putative transcriptional regulator
MPIVVKLDDMLHARRMTLTELAERIGITLANLSILKTGKARAMRFSTLEAICDVMQCQPGDLLGYAPSPAAEEAAVADQTTASSAARVQPKHPLDPVPEEV